MAASKLLPYAILIISLFLISFSTFSAACDCGGSPLPPIHKPPPAVPHSPPPTKSPPPVPKSPTPSSPPPIPKSPPPKSPSPTPKSPAPIPKSPPPVPKSPPPSSPPPTPASPPPSVPPPKTPSSPPPACPINTLKLGVCANLLGTGIIIGAPVSKPCCTVLSGLTDLQAALCLCTAVKADVLGIHLNVQIIVSVILNDCGKSVPPGFKCA